MKDYQAELLAVGMEIINEVTDLVAFAVNEMSEEAARRQLQFLTRVKRTLKD